MASAGARYASDQCRRIPVTRFASEADAAFSRQAGVGCTVMTADCLPVLLCDEAGTVVAAVHAGWRGLLDGVLEATISAMGVPGEKLLAWLGPAIGPRAFEVGDEVRRAFVTASVAATSAFQPTISGKWLADIYALARQRLAGRGVLRVFGGNLCTASDDGSVSFPIGAMGRLDAWRR